MPGVLPEGLTERREKEMALVTSFRGKGIPTIPLPAKFIPKYDLPVLEDYKGKFPMTYWSKWKKRSLQDMLPHKSWVSSQKVKEMAARAGYQDIARLKRVTKRLEEGANIGCTGRGCLGTQAKNAESAYKYPIQSTSGLTWEYVLGHFEGKKFHGKPKQ